MNTQRRRKVVRVLIYDGPDAWVQSSMGQRYVVDTVRWNDCSLTESILANYTYNEEEDETQG